MHQGTRELLESALLAAQYALVSVGVVSIAWKLLGPGGWLYWLIALIAEDPLIAENRPASLYCMAIAGAGLLAGTLWLSQVRPGVISTFLTITGAFAGTYFILQLLLPI